MSARFVDYGQCPGNAAGPADYGQPPAERERYKQYQLGQLSKEDRAAQLSQAQGTQARQDAQSTVDAISAEIRARSGTRARPSAGGPILRDKKGVTKTMGEEELKRSPFFNKERATPFLTGETDPKTGEKI